jgi:Tol biopolymer transport system component
MNKIGVTGWIAIVLNAAACADGAIETQREELRKNAGGRNGDFDYCGGTATCNLGEGDCDSNAECAPELSLICAANIGPRFGMPEGWDVCVAAHCTNKISDGDEDAGRIDCGGSCGPCACGGVSGSSTFCTASCPCESGEGDCDRHSDCIAGTICGVNNGPSYGLPAGYDVCVPPQPRERITVSSNGEPANGRSRLGDISSDGRFVVFSSAASNLVSGDTNNAADIFLRDRQSRTTTRISIGIGGAEANGSSSLPSISADGRFVTYVSDAWNLVPGDVQFEWSDIFVYDVQTQQTTRVSVDDNGVPANGSSTHSDISADGRYVVFASYATNLVPGGGDRNAYLHDRLLGRTEAITSSQNGSTTRVAISGDGQVIGLTSFASDLVPGDTNNVSDLFTYDRASGVITRASVANDGTQANAFSNIGTNVFSADGRFIVFESYASNLTPGDIDFSFDLFVYDRLSATIERMTNAPTSHHSASIDAAGRFVSYSTPAAVVIHDRSTGQMIQIHDSNSMWTVISADGRFVAYDDYDDLQDSHDIYLVTNSLAP